MSDDDDDGFIASRELLKGESEKMFFFKWANPGLYFVYLRPFLITISIIRIENSIDGVLGIRTRDRRMVGSTKTTELWQPP